MKYRKYAAVVAYRTEKKEKQNITKDEKNIIGKIHRKA